MFQQTHFRNRICLVVLACIVVAAPGPLSAANPITVDPEGGTTAWAVQPSTGRVFAALAGSDEVVEYNSAGEEVRRFTVGTNPLELLLKSDWLVAACRKSPALHFIDLKSNRRVGTLPFAAEDGPRALFCSTMNNPYIYCVTGRSSSGNISQVDIEKQSVHKQANLYGWGQSSVYHVAMSPDGKWIVPDGRGRVSPSGADLMKVNEEAFTFTQIRDYHNSFGQMVAGPFNRYWTFGNTLYPLDISKPIRKFSGAVVRIHPQWDLAASYGEGSLFLERFSDAGVIGKIALEVSPNQPVVDHRSRRSRVPSHDNLVEFDTEHNLVFVGTQYRGYWVDLRSSADSLEPIFVVRSPTEVSSMVGSPLKVPLGVTNAERDGRVKLVKKEGPEGIRVTNSELTWLPQAKDVGIQTVGLEVIDPVDGTILDRTKMTLHIKLPKVDVGFAIKTMQRCPDNRFAVLWGPSKGQESRHPAHTGSDDIAIVDLGARSVLAKKSMPSGIRTAAIDEKHVYLAPNSGNLFYRTDHGLSNHKRQFLKSAPQQLVRFVSNRLAVTGGALELFDSEKMKPVTLLALSALEPQRPTVAAQGDNVMRVGGRLIDRHDGKILRLDARSYLPCAITTSNSNQRVTPSSTILPWGRIVKGNQITNYRGSTIAQWSGSQGQIGALSTKYPMAVVVRSTVDSTTREIQIVLELRDLIDGEIKHSAVMDAQPASRAGRSPNFYGTRELLAVSDDSVIFVNRSELLIAEIPVEIASKMPVPVHFLAQQTTEIEVGKSVQIPLRVGGDSDGTQFTLMAEYTGLTLNPDSGVMTVDTSEIWESFVEANKGINTSYIRNRSGETASLLDQAENAKRYEALTGKKLARGKLAAYLPISSVLQDKEGQQDGVHFTVVVVGPRGPLDRAIAQRQAELKALQERQMEERRKAQEAREKQLAQRNAGAEMTQKRLDDLEASMRRMQVTLDKILERLEKAD